MKDRLINQLKDFINTQELSFQGVCFFMVQIRILLEVNCHSKKYDITNHYINWLLHSSLDRKSSKLILDSIVYNFETSISKNEFIFKMNKTLDTKALVQELKEILWDNFDDKTILINSRTYNSDIYWVAFLEILVNQIKERPLKFDQKIGCIKISWLDNFSVNGIQLMALNEKIVIEILSDELISRDKKMYVDFIIK